MIDETRNAAPGMLCHIAEWNGVDGGSGGKGVETGEAVTPVLSYGSTSRHECVIREHPMGYFACG